MSLLLLRIYSICFCLQGCGSSSRKQQPENTQLEIQLTGTFWKEITETLKVVPSFPSELEQFNPFTKCTQGHSKLIYNFLLSGQKGLLIRGQKASPATANAPEKFSHGCVFLPAPAFDKVILFKRISDIHRFDEAKRKQFCPLKTKGIIDALIDQAGDLKQLMGPEHKVSDIDATYRFPLSSIYFSKTPFHKSFT